MQGDDPGGGRDPVSLIRARYPGRCDYCGDAVTPGHEVLYATESKRLWCVSCSRRARWVISHDREFQEAESAPDDPTRATPERPWVPLGWKLDARGRLTVFC